MSLRRGLVCYAICVTAAVAIQAQAPAPGPQQLLEQGMAAQRAGRLDEALKLFEQTAAAEPDDATANLLAAGAAVQLLEPEAAVRYGERARALAPDDWHVDTTLVTAYAMAGDTAKRDAERAKLREEHGKSADRDARETSGFLLDRFRVGAYTVEAVEFFHPVTKLRIFYRFLLRASEGGPVVWKIDVESDPFNEDSWAKSHPEEAARSEHQFQVSGSNGDTREDEGSFAGTGDYDDCKRRVAALIAGRTGPFPGQR